MTLAYLPNTSGLALHTLKVVALTATAFKVFRSAGSAGERTREQAEGCRRSTE
jgi:hypothetical protein